MLTSLFIQNVVLIKKLSLSFDSGLTVLTGETGAGKSILLDSISLIMGGRGEIGLIREGADSLSVTAEFSVSENNPVWSLLEEHPDDNVLLIRRTFSRDGRSKAFVNDMPVTLGFLKQISSDLIEIHGQFSSYSLMNAETHLGVLDSFAHLSAEAVSSAFRNWKQTEKELKNAEIQIAKNKEEEDFLKFAVEELSALNLEDGEEETLNQKRTTLMHAEKIAESVGKAYEILSALDESPYALYKVADLVGQADSLSDGSFNEEESDIEQAASLLEDVKSRLESKTSEFASPYDQLEEIESRLFVLKDMARKYHCSIAELSELADKYQRDLNGVLHGEEHLIELKNAEKEAHETYLKEASLLHELRLKAAHKLDTAVCRELPALKLEKGKFETRITPLETGKETGTDAVGFFVSMNEGTTLSPLEKAASGGELARLVLAIKVNLVEQAKDYTLIFDEVDSGISGSTAQAVGKRLQKMASLMQVLVVTHSPQVASSGKTHFLVSKSSHNNETETTVTPLDEENRIDEIARMLSGDTVTDIARQNAESLLKNAQLTEKEIK